MKADHQPCVTQTCRFDLISHPSSSFKKSWTSVDISWSFEQSSHFWEHIEAQFWTAPKYVQVKSYCTHFFTDDKVSPSLTIFHLPFLSLQNTTRLKSGITFTCFLLSLKTFFDWSNLLRTPTLRILTSWNLSFCVHSCSLCEKINAEFSVNIVWGNSRKATSATVSEPS